MINTCVLIVLIQLMFLSFVEGRDPQATQSRWRLKCHGNPHIAGCGAVSDGWGRHNIGTKL